MKREAHGAKTKLTTVLGMAVSEENPGVRAQNAERTRRILLDAAAEVFTAKGVYVGLDEVARAAKVSKGGLMHHFPTKKDLYAGLIADISGEFAALVGGWLDPADEQPGARARAFIRAWFSHLRTPGSAERVGLFMRLAALPEAREFSPRRDSTMMAWLTADGLHRHRALLVFLGVDGSCLAVMSPEGMVPERLKETEEVLLALTDQSGRIAGPLPF